MRERIDDLIHKILIFGRVCSDEWLVYQESEGMPFVVERRNQILKEISEEIEKVGKPRGCRAYSTLYSDGFEECRQEILALFK